MKEFIEQELAPRIQADGGWVEFISFKDDTLSLRFRGEWSKCPILDRCTDWIREQVQSRFGETVRITAERKKPYFWDQPGM